MTPNSACSTDALSHLSHRTSVLQALTIEVPECLAGHVASHRMLAYLIGAM